MDIFEFLDKVDFSLPFTERIFLTFFLELGSILRISSVYPENEKTIRRSFFVNIPKSPWLASAALI